MGRASVLLKKLKAFSNWDIGGQKTQGSAKASEDFVEKCLKDAYADIEIFKMSSQQHPDFIIAPKFIIVSLKKFMADKRKPKAAKKVLEDWEESDFNERKIRLVRIEVKTGMSNYILNDTFPEPSREHDEVYILISIGEQKVFVSTSATMAESCAAKPPIIVRLKISKATVKSFQEKLSGIWSGTGISTAARPTYSMSKEYSHHNATPERIAEIFRNAGIND